MFKFETHVGRLVVTLLLAAGAPALADESHDHGEPSSSSSSEARAACTDTERNLNAAINLLNEAQRMDDTAQIAQEQKIVNDWQKRFDDCVKKNGTDYATGSCEEAKGDYNTALGTLDGACKRMGGGRSGDQTWPLCTKAINQCDACMNDNADKTGLDCDDVEVDEEEDGKQEFIGMRDIQSGEMMLKYCPGKLGADQKQLEKDLQEAKKEMTRLQSEINKGTSELSKINANAQKAIGEIQDQMETAQQKLDEQMEAAANNMDEKLSQIQQQIVAIESQIAAADDALRQVDLARNDTENKYQETLKQIDLNCHASAATTVAKMQQDRLGLEQTRQFNRGGFRNMLKNVGVSDRDAWQRKAEKYYNWCKVSKPTKASEDSALKTRDQMMGVHQAAEDKLKGEKERLRKSIESMKSKEGCKPIGNAASRMEESAMCRSMRMAQQQSERLMRQYNSEMNKANRKIGEAQMSAAQEAQAKGMEIETNKRLLAEEKMRIDNLKEFYELALKAGNNGDIKSYIEAQDKYGDYVAAARTYVNCTTERGCKENNDCNNASEFLRHIDSHPGFKDEDVDNGKDVVEATTDRPPVTPATPSGTTGTAD